MEPTNGKWSKQRSLISDEMRRKFEAHGFRGPCSECGMVPFSSLTVGEWVEHYMADELVKLRGMRDGDQR